jgi:leader peptidase (prepilin peptidase) / N-methyltransferase
MAAIQRVCKPGQGTAGVKAAWAMLPLLAATVGSILIAPHWPASGTRILLATGLLAILLVAISLIDSRSMTIPDGLSAALLVGGLMLISGGRMDEVIWRCVETLVTITIFLGVVMAYERLRGRAGMGLGDVKLIGALTPWIGLEGLPALGLLAAVSGLCAAVWIRQSRKRWPRYLPFAPHLAGGAWFVWLCGPLALA